jgi:transcriptional regulator GlxA family with amidase domain
VCHSRKVADPPDPKPIRVSLLALPESTPAVLYALYEVFSAVGVMWNALTGETEKSRRMETRIVAHKCRTFSSASGAPIAPHASLAKTNESDIVVATVLALGIGENTRGRWRAEARWIREQFERGATICSVCTGSVLLAEAGLLHEREATTHWAATGIFAEHYPTVRLRAERILCPTAPEHRIITAAGAASWEDLALHLIARFSGEREARRIAKIFLLGDRSDGQLSFSAMGQRRQHDDRTISDCQQWIADHYATTNPVGRMEQRSGLPERSFKRRFKAATGYAPIDYVQALRIEEAKQLLETTSSATDSIAEIVGYEDPAFFRKLFKRRTGITPAQYRKRFQIVQAER